MTLFISSSFALYAGFFLRLYSIISLLQTFFALVEKDEDAFESGGGRGCCAMDTMKKEKKSIAKRILRIWYILLHLL
ncbi:MAG: hypothetical protein ABIN67_03615 [Ferruginibacter sp.]